MMQMKNVLLSIAVLICGGPIAGQANDLVIDRFEDSPNKRGDYISDTVMGGVSKGGARFRSEGDDYFARLSGNVSTENNGGFIQFRHRLTETPPSNAKGVRLVVRGNGETYFIHLRTNGTRLPWQYYQEEFDTSAEWTEIRLPFSAFEASGRLMRTDVKISSLRSVGVVAYRRDHTALIDVSEIGFY
ncbi:MAG: CIA30 family protein [Pseudoruegeria sp.]